MEMREGLIPKAKSKAVDENVSQLSLEASEQVEPLCAGRLLCEVWRCPCEIFTLGPQSQCTGHCGRDFCDLLDVGLDQL